MCLANCHFPQEKLVICSLAKLPCLVCVWPIITLLKTICCHRQTVFIKTTMFGSVQPIITLFKTSCHKINIMLFVALQHSRSPKSPQLIPKNLKSHSADIILPTHFCIIPTHFCIIPYILAKAALPTSHLQRHFFELQNQRG